MNVDAVLASIERFFLDLVGTVLPGAFLLVGLSAIAGWDFRLGTVRVAPVGHTWLLFVATAYVVGHALASISSRLGKRYFAERVRESGEARLSYKWLTRQLQDMREVYPEADEETVMRDLRSIAMTLVPSEKPVVYRFTFLSLMNGGVAVSIVLLVATWGAMKMLSSSPPWPNSWLFATTLLFAIPFFERQLRFFRISQTVPFSMATAEMLKSRLLERGEGAEPRLEKAATSEIVPSPGRPTVYLAGGFHSGWQDTVMEGIESIQFIDPREHDLADPSEYAVWDLEGIRQADFLVAYLERQNPGLYALALEVGYAKALAKKILLIDEIGQSGAGRYLDMVRASADVSFGGIEALTAFLQRLPKPK